jgi:hypothetical protein
LDLALIQKRLAILLLFKVVFHPFTYLIYHSIWKP